MEAEQEAAGSMEIWGMRVEGAGAGLGGGGRRGRATRGAGARGGWGSYGGEGQEEDMLALSFDRGIDSAEKKKIGRRPSPLLHWAICSGWPRRAAGELGLGPAPSGLDRLLVWTETRRLLGLETSEDSELLSPLESFLTCSTVLVLRGNFLDSPAQN